MEYTVMQHIYSLAAVTCLVTTLVVAAVRWFHMCSPYNRKPSYYYPGRPAMTLCMLSTVIVLPYALFPGSEWTWMLARAYFFPEEIYLCTVLLFNYFGNVREWKKWKKPTVVMAVPAAVAMLGVPMVSGSAAAWLLYLAGALETVFCVIALILVARWAQWARSAAEDEFSNPKDFPTQFAREMISMLALVLVAVWVTALTGSRTVMAVLNLLLSIFSVTLLIQALHPNRHREMVEEEPESEPVVPARTREMVRAIRRVLEDEHAYLDPHLTLQDIADRVGSNRSYIARIFASEFGGFFNYVNSLRLDYADAYRQSHPKAKIGEIIAESGFGSRSTYYSAQAKLRPEKPA